MKQGLRTQSYYNIIPIKRSPIPRPDNYDLFNGKVDVGGKWIKIIYDT